MKKGVFSMKRYVNKLITSNWLKFKLVSGTHGLRSELSGWDNGCELDKEECPLYNENRDETLLQMMYSSDRFQKEWFDRDDAHGCIRLLRDYGAFVSRPSKTMKMTNFFVTYPTTVSNLSTISNLVSTSNYTSTSTVTYSSRLITFITSITTTTTTLSYDNSYSLIRTHDSTLFPAFTSLKSKIQSYQSRNNEMKDLLNLIDKHVLKLWEK
eukprot:Awhi_evm1s9789